MTDDLEWTDLREDISTLEKNRKKLDVEHFKSYGVWRFKRKKAKHLKCVNIVLSEVDRNFYRFGYKKFPKDLLYEIRKSTQVGIKDKKTYLFVRQHQIERLDPLLWSITNRITIKQKTWQRMRESYQMQKLIES